MLEYILFIPAGKEDLFDNPPQYIYNQDWELVKAVKAGEEVDFDFCVPVPDTEDNIMPFSQYPVIKELNGWFYCRYGYMTQDGYEYYPTRFQKESLKLTQSNITGYTYEILSGGLNDEKNRSGGRLEPADQNCHSGFGR